MACPSGGVKKEEGKGAGARNKKHGVSFWFPGRPRRFVCGFVAFLSASSSGLALLWRGGAGPGRCTKDSTFTWDKRPFIRPTCRSAAELEVAPRDGIMLQVESNGISANGHLVVVASVLGGGFSFDSSSI
jgi:hypothetical protein